MAAVKWEIAVWVPSVSESLGKYVLTNINYFQLTCMPTKHFEIKMNNMSPQLALFKMIATKDTVEDYFLYFSIFFFCGSPFCENWMSEGGRQSRRCVFCLWGLFNF